MSELIMNFGVPFIHSVSHLQYMTVAGRTEREEGDSETQRFLTRRLLKFSF